MDLMQRRRVMLAGTNSSALWDYELYTSPSNNAISPVEISIIAGQEITIAWGNNTIPNLNYRLWTLSNGGKFVGTTQTNLATKYIDENGTLHYVVESTGNLIIGGAQLKNASWYSFHGVNGWVKAKID